jgi:hypothetical protein
MSLPSGVPVIATGRPVYNATSDLALIPVAPVRGVTGLHVAPLPPSLAGPLWGVCHRDGTVVSATCAVREGASPFLHTDCGGAAGFSGSGYLNGSAFLVAVHRGGGIFPHSSVGWPDLREAAVFTKAWGIAEANCTRLWAGQAPNATRAADDCFERLRRSIGLEARNPRTLVAPASGLYDFVGQLP